MPEHMQTTDIPATGSEILMVFTSFPDAASAHQLARWLVDNSLAACVNILPAAQSCYRWQGQIELATEIPLLIKTTASRYAALETAIREQHPYELPEIVAIPVTRGLPAYLEWVQMQTRQTRQTQPLVS